MTMQATLPLPVSVPVPMPTGSLEAYIQTVNRFPLLTAEEEQRARARASATRTTSTPRASSCCRTCAWSSSLARGYLGYGLPHADLIQEGNIGLMKAVKRFDPDRGVRLVSFAIHWIKAEIHEYILRNWRLVKVATTKAQRKLFFNLRSMKKGLAPADAATTSTRVAARAARQARGSRRDGDAPLGPGDRLRSRARRRRGRYAPAHYLADDDAEPFRVLEAKETERVPQRRAARARSRRSTRAAAASSRRAGCARRTPRRCTSSPPSSRSRPSASARSRRRRSRRCARRFRPRREATVLGLTPSAAYAGRRGRSAASRSWPHEQAQPPLRVDHVALRAVVDACSCRPVLRFS